MLKDELKVYILPSIVAASLIAVALHAAFTPKIPETADTAAALSAAPDPIPELVSEPIPELTPPTLSSDAPSQSATAASVMNKANVGETLEKPPRAFKISGHVRAWGAQLKAAPDHEAKTVADVPGLTNVLIYPESDVAEGWVRVEHDDNAGFMEDMHLALGSGLKAYHLECANGEVERPMSGSVIAGALTGRHVLQLRGLESSDAVVTLESSSRKGGLAVYVRAGEEAVVRGVASDDYRLSYSAGERFSAVCGIFTRKAKYSENAATLDLNNEAFSETVTLRLRETRHPSA